MTGLAARIGYESNLNISRSPFPAFPWAGPIFQEPEWKKKKRRNVELGSGFGRFSAAKIEFSYGAGQTVNLLALRLQWVESTPAQTSPRAILQVFRLFGGQLGISSLIGFDVVRKGSLEPGAQRAQRCIDPRVGLLVLVGKARELTASELWNHLRYSSSWPSDQYFRNILYRIEAEVPSARRFFHVPMPGSGTPRIASAGQLDLEIVLSKSAQSRAQVDVHQAHGRKTGAGAG
jgi:hypothetical protein